MDDESKFGSMLKWGLSAIGLGGVAAMVTLPNDYKMYGIWVVLGILVLFVLVFGGYYLWQRRSARRRSNQFTSAIEAQTAAAPKSISDPIKRAALDKLRQKFQTGIQVFKSTGKDIYRLPWYVIIGESGSGKTEAIRHSGIDFPPGLQDELQGSGGTVNMDWWFTNRGIILDTAGSMIFNEARAGETPEWSEFLRLLKKVRPHSPINGLFLVLSVESLIRDSAEKIAQKASLLTQQLDLIQRTLDVRFPVYLLITKCDLLTGFREFFDKIDDPLLQHQIFGWSNPDPLDAAFRPDLVDQHLKSMAERIRRRRLALLREDSSEQGDTQHFFNPQRGGKPPLTRRLDEVDSMFSFPESIMRLAPRLRRYLETIFVAGEWSAKPVFLRGIYFTSSMREGKALDEAIAAATGLSLDELPEDRNWEKNRAFFLRDLFHEKVFRESGLVTRASNTLKLLRSRQLAIFGSAGVALLLLLVATGFAHYKLKENVGKEAKYWKAGANPTVWNKGVWESVVRGGSANPFHFSYVGDGLLKGVDGQKVTLVQYHQELNSRVTNDLVRSWIFKPLKWLGVGQVGKRAEAQRRLFEASVVLPLLRETRAKLVLAQPATEEALARHKEVLLCLLRLEADGLMPKDKGQISAETNSSPEFYLTRFLGYLTDGDYVSNTNLAGVFARTYSQEGIQQNKGFWPPSMLLGGNALSNTLNHGLRVGLETFNAASLRTQTNIDQHFAMVNDLADKLAIYSHREREWLGVTDASCSGLKGLAEAKANVEIGWQAVQTATNFHAGRLTNFAARYAEMARARSNASASALSSPVDRILLRLTEAHRDKGLFPDVKAMLGNLAASAAENIRAKSTNPELRNLDTNYIATLTTNTDMFYQLRWALYTNACSLASTDVSVDETTMGKIGPQLENLAKNAQHFHANRTNYNGPYLTEVESVCKRIVNDVVQQLTNRFISNYVAHVSRRLNDIRFPVILGADPGSAMKGAELKNLRVLLTNLSTDLQHLHPVILDRAPLLKALKANTNSYGPLVNSLINDDGTTAEWELFFVPTQGLGEDREIIKVYTVANVSMGSAKPGLTPWKDLVHATMPVSLGKGTLDSEVKISFKKLESDDDSKQLTVVEPKSWGLLRLIRDHQPKRLDNGAWQFQIKLEDKDQGLSGNATLEARLLDPNRLLPKMEDWPKQR